MAIQSNQASTHTPPAPLHPEDALDNALTAYVEAAAVTGTSLASVEFGRDGEHGAWWRMIMHLQLENGAVPDYLGVLGIVPPGDRKQDRVQIIRAWRAAYFTDKRDVPVPTPLTPPSTRPGRS